MKYLLLLLISFNLYASPWGHHPTNGTNGTDGTDGVNGMDGADGTNGRDGLPGAYFNDTQLNRAIAINAAMSSVPVQSHVDEHSHTSLGVGSGGYSSETGYAVGINHMSGKMSYKAAVGVSGSEKIIGVGASFTFD